MSAHEKGIEAAVYAYFGTDRAPPSEGNKRDIEDAIRAYLEASGQVLAPKVSTHMMRKIGQGWSRPSDLYEAMLGAYPQPFSQDKT